MSETINAQNTKVDLSELGTISPQQRLVEQAWQLTQQQLIGVERGMRLRRVDDILGQRLETTNARLTAIAKDVGYVVFGNLAQPVLDPAVRTAFRDWLLKCVSRLHAYCTDAAKSTTIASPPTVALTKVTFADPTCAQYRHWREGFDAVICVAVFSQPEEQSVPVQTSEESLVTAAATESSDAVLDAVWNDVIRVIEHLPLKDRVVVDSLRKLCEHRGIAYRNCYELLKEVVDTMVKRMTTAQLHYVDGHSKILKRRIAKEK